MKRLTNEIKKQQGVTLIALVVTIIVLIILAGVSIAILTGDNGIIKNAKQAQKNQIEGEVKDKVNLAVQSAKILAEQQSVTNPAGFFAETNLKTYNDATETTAGTYAEGDLIYKELKTSLGDGYSVHVENDGKRVIIHYETSAYKSAVNDDKAGITVPVTVSENIFTIGNYVYNNKDNQFTGTVQENAGGGTTPTIPTGATYTVSFNAGDGGSGTMAQMSNITAGAQVTLTANTFTHSTKYFAGWIEQTTGISYANKQKVTVNNDMVLVAQWTDEITTIFEGASLLEMIENNEFVSAQNGYVCQFNIANKTESYTARVYNIEGNKTVTTEEIYGIESDVGTANTYAQNMVIVKVNGDLTIASSGKITAYGNEYGGPKGLLVYCTGTLQNAGTISMTARGAKAEGQDVYLWQNTNGNYEFVPQDGENGGAQVFVASKNSGANGNPGTDGTLRKTGGGGSRFSI